MKNPPFNITENIMTDAAKISETVGRISSKKLTPAPLLRRSRRIRTIQGTLAIEQNSLSVAQVTAVICGKRVLAPPREIAEVKNAYAVYDMMEELDPYSVDSLLRAHEVMMRGLIDEAGVFRSGTVGVADGKGNVLHVGTLPRYVPESVENLLKWVKDSELPTVIKSSVFHYEFELIHPFADGNGRMGRLWHTLLLSEWEPLFTWLPVESVIRDRQQAYYEAINASNSAGESTLFIEFMLSAIKTALIEVSTDAGSSLKKTPSGETLRRRFVSDFLKEHDVIRNVDICKNLGVSPATANRLLRKLAEEGELIRVRDGKFWAYRPAGK